MTHRRRRPSAYAAWLRGEARRANLISMAAGSTRVVEVLARTHVVNPMLTIPQCGLADLSGADDTGDPRAIRATFRATIIGFTVSMAAGVAIAALLWWSGFAYKV